MPKIPNKKVNGDYSRSEPPQAVIFAEAIFPCLLPHDLPEIKLSRPSWSREVEDQEDWHKVGNRNVNATEMQLLTFGPGTLKGEADVLQPIVIYQCAALLIEQRGADAKIRAAIRAEQKRYRGDLEGERTWNQIHQAIIDLTEAPPVGTLKN